MEFKDICDQMPEREVKVLAKAGYSMLAVIVVIVFGLGRMSKRR